LAEGRGLQALACSLEGGNQRLMLVAPVVA
jgi:hypothetical protein